MTALALRDDQTKWDASQLAVLRSTGIDEDVTEPELNAFLHECQRRKLDPFTRQIYLLGRWDGQKGRKVYRSQTSIDGFRLIARRAADEAKESIEYEDTLWCGTDGRWADVWLETMPPSACKVVVLRDGKRFPATARYSGYVQVNKRDEPMGLWKKMPDAQLSKCAEALALRKAFPEELGSLYTDDEMAQADNPQHAHAVPGEVVSGNGAAPEDIWQAPPPAPAADEEWLAEALATAATFATDDEGRKLWDEANAKGKAHEVSRADVEMVKANIRKRWAELKAAAEETVEGTIVPDLDPADEWALKIGDLTTLEEVGDTIAEVAAAREAGMDEDRAAAIEMALTAKAEEISQGAAA